MLIDTGPVVALINRNDPYHALALRTIAQAPAGPLLSTWPSFTESMYLLGQSTGVLGQNTLWNWLRTRRLSLYDLNEQQYERMAELMQKYSDLPMDLADASFIAASEATGDRKVLTFDGHFRVYALSDGSSFEVVSG